MSFLILSSLTFFSNVVSFFLLVKQFVPANN